MNTRTGFRKLKVWLSRGLILIVICSMLAVSLPAHAATTQSYIIQGNSTDQVVTLIERSGGQVTSRLWIIQGAGALLTPQAAAVLRSQPGIFSVTPNAGVEMMGGPGSYPATDYPDVTGADEALAQGVDGQGVGVAVVDTGIAKHPALKHHIIAWADFVARSHKPVDPNGHGTHIAGIIANTQTGEDGEKNGMAPGVDLVGVRVLDETGYGTYETVIRGVQWVIEHRQEYHIRVMNLSLLATVYSPYWADPLNRAVMRAWADGLVVVVAAGNSGPNAMTVGVPGNVPYVITVGAFTDNYTVYDWSDDYITPFSSAGPTLDGFAKPDLVAPGAHIVSLMNAGSVLGQLYPEQRVHPQYFSLAGTSQAAAVTSGAAALILSEDPSLNNNQVKYRLMNTAMVWVDVDTTEALYSIFQQGAGRLNAYDAVFSESTDEANLGMDILADLQHGQQAIHYEGFAYYDETIGKFRMHGDFEEWDGGYWAWDGGYGAWSGGYGAWSGDFGAWAGGYGAWSGGYGAWSGGYGAWSGSYGAWSGGYGAWSGGYGAWSGGYGAWSGNEPWAGSYVAEQTFVENFLAGVSPDETTTAASISYVPEP